MDRLRDRSQWRADSKEILRQICDILDPRVHWNEHIAVLQAEKSGNLR